MTTKKTVVFKEDDGWGSEKEILDHLISDHPAAFEIEEALEEVWTPQEIRNVGAPAAADLHAWEHCYSRKQSHDHEEKYLKWVEEAWTL